MLEADIIVTATGLDLVMFGGAELAVDGKPFQVNQSMGYRGIMLRDLPNLAAVVGYTNASWTLKADLSSEYFCRLINHMDATGMRQVTARDSTGDVREEPFLNLDSGYIQRAAERMPKQGDRMPWKLYQNYVLDLALLRYGKVEDGYLVFSRRRRSGKPAAQRCRPWAEPGGHRSGVRRDLPVGLAPGVQAAGQRPGAGEAGGVEALGEHRGGKFVGTGAIDDDAGVPEVAGQVLQRHVQFHRDGSRNAARLVFVMGADIEDHRQLPLFAKAFQFLHADSRNPPAARQQALALPELPGDEGGEGAGDQQRADGRVVAEQGQQVVHRIAEDHPSSSAEPAQSAEPAAS